MHSYIDELMTRHPVLTGCRPAIERMVDLVVAGFARGGTLFTCGNGGSAADADHICGEFLKGFLLRRALPVPELARFRELFGDAGAATAAKLQSGLKAVSLLSHPGFCSAFANDVDADLIFAQQLWALGGAGDVLLALSTGGNAENVRQALMAAKVKGIHTILLTGARGGCCEALAECTVAVPETETYRIQELHLPVYHTLCMCVEHHFFGVER